MTPEIGSGAPSAVVSGQALVEGVAAGRRVGPQISERLSGCVLTDSFSRVRSTPANCMCNVHLHRSA